MKNGTVMASSQSRAAAVAVKADRALMDAGQTDKGHPALQSRPMNEAEAPG